MRVSFFRVLGALFLGVAHLAWAVDDALIVNRQTQKKLGLEFELTVTRVKNEKGYVVFFTVPPQSVLKSVRSYGLHEASLESIGDSGATAIQAMGLARIAIGESKGDPKKIVWADGISILLSEEALPRARIHFIMKNAYYIIDVGKYAEQ